MERIAPDCVTITYDVIDAYHFCRRAELHFSESDKQRVFIVIIYRVLLIVSSVSFLDRDASSAGGTECCGALGSALYDSLECVDGRTAEVTSLICKLVRPKTLSLEIIYAYSSLLVSVDERYARC